MDLEAKLNKIISDIFKEDHDIVMMSTPEYASKAEKASMEPSRGTTREKMNKEWFGSKPEGKKTPSLDKSSSKNTEGGFSAGEGKGL